MRFQHLKVRNWRNFISVDVPLGDRVFLVGPNAVGKSNFLDVFLFLRDLAKSDGGGLQRAVESRGGMRKLRSLFARRNSKVEIEVTLRDPECEVDWQYKIAISQEPRGRHRPIVAEEQVVREGVTVFRRPDGKDRSDAELLTQTNLEQIGLNRKFRDLPNVFQKTLYLHLIPQLLKHPELSKREGNGSDPYGIRFLERIMETPATIRRSRLKKIEAALRVAVPEFKNLVEIRDEVTGVPHIEATYQHWRPHGARQREDQFSDGTLRLTGLLWALLDGSSLLLLEEPEISLHSEIVRKLPALMWRIQRQAKQRRQLFVSTHSYELLSDRGIRADEILMVRPALGEGSTVTPVSKARDVRALLENGLSPAEAVIPFTRPANIEQLGLFE